MSIFLLTPKEAPPESMDTPKPNTDDTQQHINVVDGSVPPPEGTDKQEGTDTIPDSAFVAPKKIDPKTIVMDGPLSQIYTEALNQVYAKESYITEMLTMDQLNQKKEEKSPDEYIYVVDGPYLETSGYVEAFDVLSKATETYKDVYVCVEHGMNITDRVGRFLEYSRGMGCKVISTREMALEMMKSHLSGL